MILNFTCSKDNQITNAFKDNLVTRATGSSMGYADVLSVFSLYGQASSSAEGLSSEISRIIMDFPISDIENYRSSGKIPNSGSVSFYLQLFNCPHAETLMRDSTFIVCPLSQSFEEGQGLDTISYKDELRNSSGSNWVVARKGINWTTPGGDYLQNSSTFYTVNLQSGFEDINLDITNLVENWLSNQISRNGILVALTGSQEAYFSSSTGQNSGSLLHNVNGEQSSRYIKKFYGRGSDNFFKRPRIQARWNSSQPDDRGNFFYSSSRANAEDNLNTLYYRNYIRGKLSNIPNLSNGVILVSLYSGSNTPTGSKLLLNAGGGVVTTGDTEITGGIVSTGIYTASFCLTSSNSPLETVFDVLHSGNIEYFTGSFEPKKFDNLQISPTFEYFSKITNLKSSYKNEEIGRFKVYIRPKNFSPTVYNVARITPETTIIPSASYEIFRVHDNYSVIPFGTGSDLHTLTSYDVSGNYFDVDLSVLEPGYMYGIKLAYFNDERNSWDVQRETWKFRVE